MNFDFQSMKPVIQAELDEVFQYYPTDVSAIKARGPTGGDAYVRKLAVVEAIARLAPVHILVRVLQDTLAFSRTGVPDAQYCRIYQYGRFETGSFEALLESFLWCR